MLFDKTGKPAVAILGIAMLAGILPLGGCSDSTTGATGGRSGDKTNDPAPQGIDAKVDAREVQVEDADEDGKTGNNEVPLN